MKRSLTIACTLAILLALSVFAANRNRAAIEADLLSSAQGLVDTGPFDWARLSAEGCVVAIGGSPPSTYALEEASTLLGRLDGVCKVIAGGHKAVANQVGGSNACHLEASRGPRTVRLAGTVPDRAAVDALISAADKSAGVEVIANLETGCAGASAGWTAAGAALVAATLELPRGEARLSGRKISLTGLAMTEDSATRLSRSVLADPPRGFETAANIVALAATSPLEADECQLIVDLLLQIDPLRFAPGTAEILPESYALLDRLAFAAGRCPQAKISIGLTSPESEDPLLTRQRPDAVAKYLIQTGIAAQRFSAETEVSPAVSGGAPTADQIRLEIN